MVRVGRTVQSQGPVEKVSVQRMEVALGKMQLSLVGRVGGCTYMCMHGVGALPRWVTLSSLLCLGVLVLGGTRLSCPPTVGLRGRGRQAASGSEKA